MTINLPQTIEQAYLAAAQREGVSIDALVTQVLVSHVPLSEPPAAAQVKLIEKKGLLVLSVGEPLSPEVVDETLESIRLERDLVARGCR